MGSRLAKLRDSLHEKELDAILISSPENRRYVSGFTGSAGYLLISSTEALLCTDFRYIEQAGRQAPEFQVERIRGGLEWFPRLCAKLGVKEVGFESADMTVRSHEAFLKAIKDAGGNNLSLKGTLEVVEMLRAWKDEEELGLITRAVEIADEAIDEVSPTIEAGQTEAEVAWRLEKAMRQKGAESLSFEIIVGSGPNGALPHHRAAERLIALGEPIVIDMGAKYRGYCSDLTRTIVLGEPDETFRKVYNIVLEAQLAAESAVEEGMTGGGVDNLARQIIQDAGYGESFGHGLGHGVGLEVHEYPGVGPKSDHVMANGMVFTIEPGIYIPGWGGVRIEDVLVLEKGRGRVLSKARKREGGK